MDAPASPLAPPPQRRRARRVRPPKNGPKPFKVFYGLQPGHWLMIPARTKKEAIRKFDAQEEGTGKAGFRAECI